MRDLQHFVPAVNERPAVPIFRARVAVSHEGAAKAVVDPGFQHALFEAVSEAVDAVLGRRDQASDFEGFGEAGRQQIATVAEAGKPLGACFIASSATPTSGMSRSDAFDFN